MSGNFGPGGCEEVSDVSDGCLWAWRTAALYSSLLACRWEDIFDLGM